MCELDDGTIISPTRMIEHGPDRIGWTDTAAGQEALAADPTAAATNTVHRLVGLCNSDPVRYQLLFHRTIRGFVRWPEAGRWPSMPMREAARFWPSFGVHDQGTLDLWTAVMAGLGNQ